VPLIALEPGHWELSCEDRLDELNYRLLAAIDSDWPVFAHLQAVRGFTVRMIESGTQSFFP
jgi:hypothetical protein